MPAKNLKECIEGGGRIVVVLVEGRGSRLDTFRVSYGLLADILVTQRRRGKLTLQQALKQLHKLLLVHGKTFTV